MSDFHEEWHARSMTGLAAGLAAGEFSSVELTEALLERIARFDSELNAFITVADAKTAPAPIPETPTGTLCHYLADLLLEGQDCDNVDDCYADTDGDGLSDLEERKAGTPAVIADGDRDGRVADQVMPGTIVEDPEYPRLDLFGDHA